MTRGGALFELNKEIPLEKKSNDILCVGEILVDLIASNYSETVKEQAFYPYFGGSPANIAINTKRLGLNSKIVANVGQDRFGDFLIENLKEANVSTQYIMRSENSTSMVVLNRSLDTPIPTFYRDADFQIHYTSGIKQLLQASSILHISSWPASKNPAKRSVIEMKHDAKENNVLIGFDPNFHRSVWNEGTNPHKEFLEFLEMVDVIKPSMDDAERIFGHGNEITQLNRFLDYGVKLVILTLGADGVIVSNGKETLHLNSLASEVVDTTGAGDAFWSGLYAGIINKLTIKEAIQLGLAASAYKLKYIGAMAPLPEYKELITQYKL